MYLEVLTRRTYSPGTAYCYSAPFDLLLIVPVNTNAVLNIDFSPVYTTVDRMVDRDC